MDKLKKNVAGKYASLTYFQKTLLFVFPFIYFIAGAYFRELIGNLSLRNCDPEYIYFMSGLTMSEGALKVGHIDNPGTPLQVFMAIVFKAIHLIRSVDVPYLDDVLLHPDLYLSITNLSITFLTAVLLFFAGRFVLKKTKSILYAMLIQTAPFLPVIWYDLIGRITPELMMPFPLILLTLLTIGYFGEDGAPPYKYAFLFALAIGFGLSIKLSFLPILLIPLIILKGWRVKVSFLIATTLSFFIIAFPVTLQFNIFWSWVKALFLHSGGYGGGEANIVDFNALQAHIIQIINLEKRFFYLFVSLVVVFTGYLLILRKKANRKVVLLNISIIITIIAQLLMIGKHYAHRYFIPVMMLSPLIIFSMVETAKNISKNKTLLLLLNLAILIAIACKADYNYRWLHIKTQVIADDVGHRQLTWHFASTLDKESIKIIASKDYGCPFIEYTLMYSQVWANNKKKVEYQDVLNRLYPNSFSHFTWDNSIKYWGEKFDAHKIIGSGKKVYLYTEKGDKGQLEKTIARLKEESATGFTAKSALLYQNPFTTETIYQLELTDLPTTDMLGPQ